MFLVENAQFLNLYVLFTLAGRWNGTLPKFVIGQPCLSSYKVNFYIILPLCTLSTIWQMVERVADICDQYVTVICLLLGWRVELINWYPWVSKSMLYIWEWMFLDSGNIKIFFSSEIMLYMLSVFGTRCGLQPKHQMLHMSAWCLL